jgi:nucleotide-binding universal stress UspA family protein/nitrite reductase/ring-hydroxylating ferredoxin subunit
VAELTALELATRHDARVIAVSAYEPPGVTPEAALAVAEQAAEAARARGVEAVAMAQRGEPADVVLQMAEREEADVIVVGNKGMAQGKRFRLGGVPDRIAHNAGCDVLIVFTTLAHGPAEAVSHHYRNIVAGTDGSPTANESVRKAFELALIHRASVLMLYVGDPIVGTIHMENAARTRPDSVDVQMHPLKGDPADEITGFAEREKADLIVVGTKGLAGARRFLLGSVPEKVARESPTDVLIVRTVDRTVDDILPDHGAVVDLDGKRMAVYRDPEGQTFACSARCTHMGCMVGWNDAEKSWDCPCHGSRYDRFGHVIKGPARADLEGAPSP